MQSKTQDRAWKLVALVVQYSAQLAWVLSWNWYALHHSTAMGRTTVINKSLIYTIICIYIYIDTYAYYICIYIYTVQESFLYSPYFASTAGLTSPQESEVTLRNLMKSAWRALEERPAGKNQRFVESNWWYKRVICCSFLQPLSGAKQVKNFRRVFRSWPSL